MRHGIIAAASILFVACAQVRDLQGGDKDVTPPLLLNADPPPGSVRFQARRILLHFNERIRLDKVREQLIVSPPLDRAPEVSISGGSDVLLTLSSSLAANTTYTFNFGNAVVDITEGNPATDLSYVISTGDVLDSLAIGGVVTDAFTEAPVEGALVMLYADSALFRFTSGHPTYFARSAKDGSFRATHLRAGTYAIRALGDMNANYRFDLPGERIAFQDNDVVAGDSNNIALRVFTSTASRQGIGEATVIPERAWRLILARSADTLRVRDIDRTGGSLVWSEEWNPGRDTLLMWPSDTALLDGVRFEMSDSSGVIDTLVYRVLKPMPYYVTAKASGKWIEGAQPFVASRPLVRIDPERIAVNKDGKSIPFVVDPAISGGRTFRLLCDDGEAPKAMVELLPGALHDVYGASNDTLHIGIGGAEVAETGELRIHITADSTLHMLGPFIVQLLSGGSIVSSEVFTAFPHAVIRPRCPAGTFTLRIIGDADGDGRWSTGSLATDRQPERVFPLREDIIVRAGWEVVVDRVVRAAPPSP